MSHKQRIEKLEGANKGMSLPRLFIYDPKEPDTEHTLNSTVTESVTIYLPDNGRDQ